MKVTDKTVQDVLDRLRQTEGVGAEVSAWARDIEPWPEAPPITAAAVGLIDLRHGGSNLEAWVTFRDAKENVGMTFVNANDSAILEHRLNYEELVPAGETADRAVAFLTAQIAKMVTPPEPPVQLPPPKPSEFLTVPTEDLARTLWNDGKD